MRLFALRPIPPAPPGRRAARSLMPVAFSLKTRWSATDLARGGAQRPLPRKQKRSRPADGPRELLRAEYPHHVWAIDFQFDQTIDRRRLKLLNIVDQYSRRCLAIRVGRRCKAIDVIDSIEELLNQYPEPTHLRMDNGPKFIAHAL